MYSAGQKAGIIPTSLPTDTEAPAPEASATLRPSLVTPESDLSLLKCTSTPGVDFCLATGTIITDLKALETTMRQYCNNKDSSYCDINTWTDANSVPASYPLTDDQLNTRLAQYKKNNPTNYDCFILFLHDEQIYRSSTCSDPLGSIDAITPQSPTSAQPGPTTQPPAAYVKKYGGDLDTYTEIMAMTDCDALQRKAAISSANIAFETKTPDVKRFQENIGYLTAAQDQLSSLVCPTATPTEIATTSLSNLVPQSTTASNPTSAYPAGATALCNDGTYSYSKTHQGTCSRHGGVARWLP